MYDFAKTMYQIGKLDKAGLQKLVDNGRITAEQMAVILAG